MFACAALPDHHYVPHGKNSIDYGGECRREVTNAPRCPTISGRPTSRAPGQWFSSICPGRREAQGREAAPKEARWAVRSRQHYGRGRRPRACTANPIRAMPGDDLTAVIESIASREEGRIVVRVSKQQSLYFINLQIYSSSGLLLWWMNYHRLSSIIKAPRLQTRQFIPRFGQGPLIRKKRATVPLQLKMFEEQRMTGGADLIKAGRFALAASMGTISYYNTYYWRYIIMLMLVFSRKMRSSLSYRADIY